MARHNEPADWLRQAPPDWEVRVVQKGDHLKNLGREASSYFYALADLRDHLADDDLVCCVQGNPFPHTENLIELLSGSYNSFTPFGVEHLSDALGLPTHNGLPVQECCEGWLKKPWPGSVRFTAGAQFVVTGREVRRFTTDDYKLMQEHTMAHELAPWVMERLWRTFFEE